MDYRVLTICAVSLLSGCNKPAPESVEPSPVVAPVATPAKTPVVKTAPVVVKTPTPIPIAGEKSYETRFSSRRVVSKKRVRRQNLKQSQSKGIATSELSSAELETGMVVDPTTALNYKSPEQRKKEFQQDVLQGMADQSFIRSTH